MKDHLENPIIESKIKKISPDQVEVVDENASAQAHHSGQFKFQTGNIKVFKGGPVFFVLATIFLPIILISLFVLAFFALFFGRGVFKVLSWVMPNSVSQFTIKR